MTEPVWWPEVVAAADRRRHVTGLFLAHATPSVARGRLRLAFNDPRMAAAWHESRAEAALEGALAHLGWSMPIEVRTLATQEVH